MLREELRRRIEAELQAARTARANGNEGRARVCARRAAGHAIRGYREAIGPTGDDHSAYFLLHWIAGQASLDPSLRASAARLAVRVTPAHDLPHPQDPLTDATCLIEGLLDKLPARPTAGERKAEDGQGGLAGQGEPDR